MANTIYDFSFPEMERKKNKKEITTKRNHKRLGREKKEIKARNKKNIGKKTQIPVISDRERNIGERNMHKVF